jgi:peptidoglycan/xylan/chitin deacetylase (PgdA/CDA1 family)
MGLKHSLLRLGLATLAGSGAHRVLAPMARGRGVILTMHHVRPWREQAFSPNRILEITPEFLDCVLQIVRANGFEFVTLGAGVARLADPEAPPFCVITADDGYRDNLDFALPVLRRHDAPLTLFVTTGFADRTAPLWWTDLEDAIAVLDRVEIDRPEGPRVFATVTPAQKQTAFEAIYWALRSGPEAHLRTTIAGLARQAGVVSAATVDRLCLDWEGIAALARDPLVSIGVHTVNHLMLAKHDDATVRYELREARAQIEHHIGKAAPDLAFPVGDPTSAGAREFDLARKLGFRCALTTRPGMLFSEHLGHETALPRVSLNGRFQRQADVEVLLSGAPFWLWNQGRRLNVA